MVCYDDTTVVRGEGVGWEREGGNCLRQGRAAQGGAEAERSRVEAGQKQSRGRAGSR